jgi:DNA-binding HxlR family transcriptional regulator
MHHAERRSECLVNFAVETFGDRWSLLIVRDIVFFGRRTYSDFLNAEEGIATNILASRLDLLQREGILRRNTDATDRRREIYSLTEKGLDLIPVVLEMAAWSAKYTGTSAPASLLSRLKGDRARLLEEIRETVRSGGRVFAADGELPGRA